MTRRRESLLLLLGSIHDHLPALGSNFTPTRGLVAAERRPCPDCTSSPGYRVDSFKRRVPCVTCGGAPEPSGKRGQWVGRDAGTGVIRTDPMDTLAAAVSTVEQAAPPTKAPRLVTCDACDGSGVGGAHLDDLGGEYRDPCRYCSGSGKRAVVALATPELERTDTAGLTGAIARRDKAGDYHALDWALNSLSRRHRGLVLDVHGPGGQPLEPGSPKQRVLEAALVLLEARMPARIKVAGSVREAARRRSAHLQTVRGRGMSPQALKARDGEIRKLARGGKPRQWIAAEYGLDVSRVTRIINGEREAAA